MTNIKEWQLSVFHIGSWVVFLFTRVLMTWVFGYNEKTIQWYDHWIAGVLGAYIMLSLILGFAKSMSKNHRQEIDPDDAKGGQY